MLITYISRVKCVNIMCYYKYKNHSRFIYLLYDKITGLFCRDVQKKREYKIISIYRVLYRGDFNVSV